MKRTEFNDFIQHQFEVIQGISTKKGRDYAGDDDALANFKIHAAQLGLTPEQVWGVYAAKHWTAVMAYCKYGQIESEPIETRLQDIILYSLLLLAMKEEGEASKRATQTISNNRS